LYNDHPGCTVATRTATATTTGLVAIGTTPSICLASVAAIQTG
jgi:hypothetical protein